MLEALDNVIYCQYIYREREREREREHWTLRGTNVTIMERKGYQEEAGSISDESGGPPYGRTKSLHSTSFVTRFSGGEEPLRQHVKALRILTRRAVVTAFTASDHHTRPPPAARVGAVGANCYVPWWAIAEREKDSLYIYNIYAALCERASIALGRWLNSLVAVGAIPVDTSFGLRSSSSLATPSVTCTRLLLRLRPLFFFLPPGLIKMAWPGLH